MSEPGESARQGRAFQAPRGTRDFYPIEMARRRWLEERWRGVSVRHGFEEIDGPRFEHLDLYTVKSGEGIVNELFSFSRAGGETPYALRPEFTPTLARMVAAKANALGKPVKWFSVGPYFRAERPQRGRLREFLQWNVDQIGDASPEADAEVIACCVDSLREVGLGPGDVKVQVSDRAIVTFLLAGAGVPREDVHAALGLLDRRSKMERPEFDTAAKALGLDTARFDALCRDKQSDVRSTSVDLWRLLGAAAIEEWCALDLSIVRGLAYYTGTVFEVHETGGKERAIAGGGRYDNLVELFGGPPTPAVGFAMGDVVISLVLQDKGLMPKDDEIARDLGLAPDVFVIGAGDESSDAEATLRPVLAGLRRAGLHARRSYKSTKNVGKLLGDANKAGARFALILEGRDATGGGGGGAIRARLKDLSFERSGDGDVVSAGSLAEFVTDVVARIPPV